jgi:hypothetical protein
MIVKEIKNDKWHGFLVYCPACRHAHQYDVGRWQFNGNFEKPTFTPSMLEYYTLQSGERKHVCHSFLTDGVWKFLSDCMHSMKDKEVPVVPFPENYGFGDQP